MVEIDFDSVRVKPILFHERIVKIVIPENNLLNICHVKCVYLLESLFILEPTSTVTVS